MSPKLRWGLATGLAAIGILGIAVGAVYWAGKYVPPFYAMAVDIDPEVAQTSSNAMLRQTAAVASDIRRGRTWQALFTAKQINGWLAYDVPRNHPKLLPSEVHDPRIQIKDDLFKIAFRWHGSWSSVVSCQLEIYLQEPSIIAIRIRQARAGKLPLPLDGLVQSFVDSARDAGVLVDQRQIDSDPLLLVILPTAANDAKSMLLDRFELRDGGVFLAGRTDRDAPAVATRPEHTMAVESK
ncbi:MAG: hypothetical protein IT427_15790 [Pirellulales bacterium]|nr:hypothetical protein [Pirellulales bacterium]